MEDILSNARQPEVRLFSLFKCLDATKFELCLYSQSDN